jgi:phosphoinositide-3-kinase regulatory subunit
MIYHYRKDGVNRLIRIMYRGGYFGFAEPLEFTSVIELVEFYQTHSLQPYSPKLDITLMEPVSKQDFDENEVGVQRSDVRRRGERDRERGRE